MSAKKVAASELNPRDSVQTYVGPTLHRRTLVEGSSYRGGLSAHVAGLMEKIPELRTLIVPMADVANVRRRTQEPGTEENRVYQYLRTVRFDDKGEVRA